VGKARSNGHSELDRITAFRDQTYTFADIADEFYIPELRAIMINGYKRCVSGITKMMGIIDISGMFEWDAKTANGFENFCLLYKNGVPMTTGNDTMIPCTPAMVGLDLLLFDHVLKSKPTESLSTALRPLRSPPSTAPALWDWMRTSAPLKAARGPTW
jgi:hypothetical protein